MHDSFASKNSMVYGSNGGTPYNNSWASGGSGHMAAASAGVRFGGQSSDGAPPVEAKPVSLQDLERIDMPDPDEKSRVDDPFVLGQNNQPLRSVANPVMAPTRQQRARAANPFATSSINPFASKAPSNPFLAAAAASAQADWLPKGATSDGSDGGSGDSIRQQNRGDSAELGGAKGVCPRTDTALAMREAKGTDMRASAVREAKGMDMRAVEAALPKSVEAAPPKREAPAASAKKRSGGGFACCFAGSAVVN